ncbi:hypothetical protein IFM89_038592 [Coptis chinensis]|uniref:Neprosin PEP catalytic domain-containing protein n=1 Tax=Coptis chinensis TaxID=261450 RepID=A0A835LL08_9MAGN|nr:hypothetical protein IFM89_038592 [Coptis chinensis]
MASSNLLIVSLLVLTTYVVGGKALSKEEDLELEKQLNSLNKPPVKTIQEENGDLFDCIGINKQPAFDHPLLKDHKIQLRPSWYPKPLVDVTTSTKLQSTTMVKGTTFWCPKGTVPIRRTQKEDLIRAKSFLETFPAFPTTTIQPNTPGTPRSYQAAIFTNYTTKGYFGVGAYINIHNPKVGPQQWSSSQIYIASDFQTTYDFDALSAGWAANRTFCYNLLCNGFVQINHELPIGHPFSNISVYDGAQFDLPLYIGKDPKTGNWWLVNTYHNFNYGYWPKELFPSLMVPAPFLAWGGYTKTGDNETSPPMGSGYFEYSGNHTSYFRALIAANVNYEITLPYSKFEMVTDGTPCYIVGAVQFDFKEDIHYNFVYGGPGGKCG